MKYTDLINQYALIKEKGKLPFSGIISIEPTYRCNLSCSTCFYKKKHYNKELNARNFIDFLDSVPNLTSIYFPAIEPLVKKGFFDIVNYLKKRDTPLLLLTNGTLINKKNFSKLVYFRRNIIMLSIDGDKDIHNKIRGANCFNSVVQAVKLLKDKCNLVIVCVICKDNVNEIWKMPRIIRNIGFNKITFEFERKYTDKDIKISQEIIGDKNGFSMLRQSKQNKPTYSFEELINSINKLEEEAKKYNITVDFLPLYFKEKIFDIYERRMREKYKLTCRYLNKIRIDPEGNFIHCFAVRSYFGNIMESSIEDIWNSKKYREFRKKILNHNLMPICETCWGAIPIDEK